ncbi:nucleotidyltransferase family protein [Candidatus Woesearchaeota archaeon]|nr:nucleotidyltransferase family protein [Candidatus Woesearchaeota archaeon]
MKAIILAGGKGERLKPITDYMPKSLVPVNNKPIVQYVIELFKDYGIKDLIIAIGYLKERIKNDLKDGKELGVNISYVEENEPLGTAGPLRLLKSSLKETFYCSNGDELKDVNLEGMLSFHKEKKALITLALKRLDDVTGYGIVKVNPDKRVIEFIEKPEKAESNLISAGLYIIEPEVIEMIPEGFCMFEKKIFPEIVKLGRLYGYEFNGDFYTIDNFERYLKVLDKFSKVKPSTIGML